MATLVQRRFGFLTSDHPLPWLFPAIAILVVFALFPFFYSVWLSFHEFVPRKRTVAFVGWENWVTLWQDQRAWDSLKFTMLYSGVGLSIQVVLGMGIALLLDTDETGFGILRALLTLTLVVPPAIAGMMFLLLEDAQFGFFTWVLKGMGLLQKGSILGDPTMAFWGVMIADVWQWTPFMVLIFIAGLRALPRDPFEAASIDGASAWQTFKRLTLPMMGKTIGIAVLIRGIDLFRTFDYVFVMTAGGPGTSTYTLSLYAWKQTFSFVKWGYGATISLLSLFVILIIANIFVSVTKMKW